MVWAWLLARSDGTITDLHYITLYRRRRLVGFHLNCCHIHGKLTRGASSGRSLLECSSKDSISVRIAPSLNYVDQSLLD
jgi:hypothetical protein